MLNYIVRRILLMIPTLLAMTAVVFFVMALTPGGIGGAMLVAGNVRGAEAERIRDYYRHRYHIDKPVFMQYGYWLNQISPLGWKDDDNGHLKHFGLKSPSFGESTERHRPVADLLAESLPITLLLNSITIPIVYATGIITGIRAARRKGNVFDTAFGATQLITWSLPAIWVGVMLIGFLANREYVKAFPVGGLHELGADQMTFLPSRYHGHWDRGWLADAFWHLALPIICLTYGSSAFLTKLVRGSVLENLGAEYARTARAKGLDEKIVLYRHVFRNSLLSLITVVAAILPSLISGAVIIESIFSIHGMGLLAVEATKYKDREVVLAVVLIGGTLTLISTLIRDILYAAADPRVSYD